MENIEEKLKKIRCFIFDLDGVLTNGTMLIMEKEHFHELHMHDIFAMCEAVEAGYKVIVLSHGKSKSMEKYMDELQITEFVRDAEDKKEKLQDIIKKHKLDRDTILYMGDDLPDKDALQICAVRACPATAVAEIKSIAEYISDKPGGHGCVRDVIEKVMRQHGKWNVKEKQ
jgi:3-deoxy-D-manno-octulosonate 8-phosphate phosphatase (KDO 8-P phosphatase)